MTSREVNGANARQNPKFEIRNKPKIQNLNREIRSELVFEMFDFLTFEIVSDFEFRVSDFPIMLKRLADWLDDRTGYRELMREAVRLEQAFIADCLPVEGVGLSREEFSQYIDYIADRRLEGVGLAPLSPGAGNPLPWLAELMDIRKEQNFFEGRVTEYQKASALAAVADEEL